MLTYTERNGKGLFRKFEVDKVVLSKQTKFQKMEIVDTVAQGRVLFLDGDRQSSALDEFIYHEVMVHPALHMLLKNGLHPRKVLIIGGSEGATTREVLKYPKINRIVHIDIDEDVHNACVDYLAEWHLGSFEHHAVEFVLGDGRKFLKDTEECFDAILVDVGEPEPGSPANVCFSKQFYELAKKKLCPKGGVIATQAGSIQPHRLQTWAKVAYTMKQVYGNVTPMWAPEILWGFCMSYHGPKHNVSRSGWHNIPNLQYYSDATTAVSPLILKEIGHMSAQSVIDDKKIKRGIL